jgi:hypothetical protein
LFWPGLRKESEVNGASQALIYELLFIQESFARPASEESNIRLNESC